MKTEINKLLSEMKKECVMSIGMPVVRTDGRAGGLAVYGHVITKFSRMGSLQHFFNLWCSAARTRAPLKKPLPIRP